MLSNLHVSLKGHTNIQLDESMLRHMCLNSIRSYRAKFSDRYGDNIVIAFDDKHSWRKDSFPYYKIRRKKARDKSELDWPFIMDTFAKFYTEFKDNFPYRIIKVAGAEADDIIGTLVHSYADTEDRILVVSGDADFDQLVVAYQNVDVYNPISSTKKTYKTVDKDCLREKVIRGDAGDDVPNVLSPDDTFATGVRQKVMTQKRFDELMNSNIETWAETPKRNYARNDLMINLKRTPTPIQDVIINVYENEAGKSRARLYNYFVKHRLKNLIEQITEF